MVTKKAVLLASILVITTSVVMACPVCERQQPKILRGITHGAGPDSSWDYLIIWSTILIVLLTLYFSIKYLVRPGEKSSDHIKRTVLFHE